VAHASVDEHVFLLALHRIVQGDAATPRFVADPDTQVLNDHIDRLESTITRVGRTESMIFRTAVQMTTSFVSGVVMWDVLDLLSANCGVTRISGILLYFAICGLLIPLIQPDAALWVVLTVYAGSYFIAYFKFFEPMFVGDALIGIFLASLGFTNSFIVTLCWRIHGRKRRNRRTFNI
jgi:hypothetical protein